MNVSFIEIVDPDSTAGIAWKNRLSSAKQPVSSNGKKQATVIPVVPVSTGFELSPCQSLNEQGQGHGYHVRMQKNFVTLARCKPSRLEDLESLPRTKNHC